MTANDFNLNLLRVFESVYRTKSMTQAAKELHLTQSGISQHIKTLEDYLGMRLFDRVQQKLVPTSQCTELYQECNARLNEIDVALSRLQQGELGGRVVIGMPIEFGNNIILPKIAEFSSTHPRVKFQFWLGFASEMNNLLLRGECDFAFVDDFTLDKRIETQRVYDEELELCISSDALGKMREKKTSKRDENTKAFLETLNYVDYQEGDPVLRMWFGHHYKSRHLELKVKARIMDVQGLAQLIIRGMGAGVLPSHVIGRLKSAGHELHVFKGSGKPLCNTIRMAYLEDRTHSPAAAAVMKSLIEGLKETNSGKLH